jgi:hypothetical protein
VQTDTIAKLIVTKVNEKKFTGKDDIVADEVKDFIT